MQIIWRFFNSFLEATGAVICHISHRVNKSRWVKRVRGDGVAVWRGGVVEYPAKKTRLGQGPNFLGRGQLQAAKTNNSILFNPSPRVFLGFMREIDTDLAGPYPGGGCQTKGRGSGLCHSPIHLRGPEHATL